MLAAIIALALSAGLAFAESETPPETPPGQQVTEAPTPVQPTAQAQAPVAPAPQRQDALALFRQGRSLDAAGKAAEAQAKYAQSVAICDSELSADPSRIEAYVVKGWSLFRMGRHDEVIATGQAGLKIAFDARIVEVMGESYYFLGRMNDCLRSLQKYIEVIGETGDRGPSAYFYMGEAYLRLKKYSHADMAYSTALKLEPNMPRWWYRLGNTYESLGDWKRADEVYAKALALNPAYQDALDARSRVKPNLAQ